MCGQHIDTDSACKPLLRTQLQLAPTYRACRGPTLAALAAAALLALPRGAAAATLACTNWGATATDYEYTAANNPPSLTFDGSAATFWHSKYSNPAVPLPHAITLDFGGGVNSVSGLVYQPRQDGNKNGNIGKYEIYVSANGVDFGALVATGTFADDATTKTFTPLHLYTFTAPKAMAVRLKALTEAGGRGPCRARPCRRRRLPPRL
jgi:F5/8 type C domain